jgi:hypothetical protein
MKRLQSPVWRSPDDWSPDGGLEFEDFSFAIHSKQNVIDGKGSSLRLRVLHVLWNVRRWIAFLVRMI